MGKIGNAIMMLELLSTGRKYSIKELSEIIEVSPRMIRTYKEELEKSGIYIDTIRGPYGGYVLNQSIKIPRRKFKKSDYEFLAGLDVSENDKKRIQELSDKIRGIYFGSREEKNELNEEIKPYYNILVNAIKDRRKVKILYYSYNKGENERVIHPLDMFLMPNGWGVAAFCEARQDLRHFELRRIRKIELLTENF